MNFEATHVAADGTLRDIEFSLKPVNDETGKVVLLVPEGRDITEQKRSEEALREAAVKYRIIADNTYNWEFWLSPQNRLIYSSPSCRRITGHGTEEFDANPDLIPSLIHPEDRNLWISHRHDVINDVTPNIALVNRAVRDMRL